MKQIKHITKTRILSALMIVMMILSSGVLSYIAAMEEQMADKHLKYILYLDEFTDTSNYLTQQVRSFLVTEDIKYYDNFWHEINTVKNREANIAQLKSLGLTKEEEKMIDNLVEISNNQILLEDQVLTYVINGERAKAKDIIFGEEYDSGGAGIITNVTDYAKLMAALAGFGMGVNGERILSAQSVELMRTNQLTPEQMKTYKEKFHHAELLIGTRGYEPVTLKVADWSAVLANLAGEVPPGLQRS